MSNNMEGWYCQQDCRQVRMPSRMPESMDDTPEDEDDSSSHASSIPGCQTPGCRRHFTDPKKKMLAAATSPRGNSLRSNATTHDCHVASSGPPPKPSRSPRKCYSAIDIEAGRADRFGSAPNLERYHDWCSECMVSSSHSPTRRKAAPPTSPNGGTPRFPSSPKPRRTLDHLPKSSNAEPFYPSKSPFRKVFKEEKRRESRKYALLCIWILISLVVLILYFVLLGENLRQRNMLESLSQLLSELNPPSTSAPPLSSDKSSPF